MSIFNRAPRTGSALALASVVSASVVRAEVYDACIKLGVDLNTDHAEALTVGDLVRLAYREGVRATEHRLMSPDVADAIAVAIESPEKILPESDFGGLRRQVAAVQQAAVYGVPK